MTNLTHKQLATLARALGAKSIKPANHPDFDFEVVSGEGWMTPESIPDLIIALLLKLRERGDEWWRLDCDWFLTPDSGRPWITPTDLLAAIADAREDLE